VSGFAYILRCSDGSYYVGSTTNLESRFDAHRLGLAGEYTSKRLPVRLVWAEEFETISEAFAIEHQIKGWRRAKKEALIAGRFELLPELAKTARPMLKKGPETGLRQAQAASAEPSSGEEPIRTADP
jgi:putative endonuclease